MKQVLWGLAFLWISFAAHAQYPNKPVRVVVPFPAGSSTDIVTRVLANSVSQSIGQQLVDRKSTRLNSSHLVISYAVFCLKKKKKKKKVTNAEKQIVDSTI